jgi:hypothetical protein
MDQFSIPERMDPVARVENQRSSVSPDRRRREKPPSRPDPNANNEDAQLPAEEETQHDLDELA